MATSRLGIIRAPKLWATISPEPPYASNQIKSTQSVVSLGLKHSRFGTHTPIMSLGNTGGDSVQLKPDQINSKCCLPQFETQPARNTHLNHVPR